MMMMWDLGLVARYDGANTTGSNLAPELITYYTDPGGFNISGKNMLRAWKGEERRRERG